MIYRRLLLYTTDTIFQYIVSLLNIYDSFYYYHIIHDVYSPASIQLTLLFCTKEQDPEIL